MAFEKGKSGNPGGRAAKSQQQIDFEYKCKNWAALFAFPRLEKAANSENIKESLTATQEILNRAFGKSVETSIVEANVTAITGSTVEELAGEIASLIPGTAGASGPNNIQAPMDGAK